MTGSNYYSQGNGMKINKQVIFKIISIKGTIIIIPIIIGVVIIVISIIGILSKNASPSSEKILIVTSSILNEQIDEASRGYLSPEGAIIIQVGSVSSLEPYHWIKLDHLAIWKIDSGKINSISEEDLGKIQKENNPLVFVFSIQKETDTEILVDIVTYYPEVATEHGFVGGGQASHWRIEKIEGLWKIVDNTVFLHWD
jgi:hypothetical protein